jgi:uncharacterized protein YeeX (DUF496 family)
MYNELSRYLVHEMSREDIDKMIDEFSGDSEQKEDFKDFIIRLREELSNMPHWKTDSLKIREEVVEDWDQLLTAILTMIKEFCQKESLTLGKFPRR